MNVHRFALSEWHPLGWGVFARNGACLDGGCDIIRTETKATYLQDGTERIWSQSAQDRKDQSK